MKFSKLVRAIAPGCLKNGLPMTDNNYGSSHFREFPPISSRLKVTAGEVKNPTARQQRAKLDLQPLTEIKRGDRSATIWSKKKAAMHKGESIATVETSSLDEADAILFESPETVEGMEFISDVLIDAIEHGEMTEQEAEDLMDVMHQLDSSDVIIS